MNAFVRVLQLVQPSCRKDRTLAVKVTMVRHVLRRLVHRPAQQSADSAVLAGLVRSLAFVRAVLRPPGHRAERVP